MKIKYKKQRFMLNFILGLVWIILGAISLMKEGKALWSEYLYLVLGAFYIGNYIYQYVYQYLIIENNIIKKNGILGFGKEMNLNEIYQIKKFAGDYTLKSKTNQLIINTNLIEKESLIKLNDVLSKLNLPT